MRALVTSLLARSRLAPALLGLPLLLGGCWSSNKPLHPGPSRGLERLSTLGAEQQDPTGLPRSFDAGDRACYAVWFTPDEGWHLGVTTAGTRRHFRGHIRLKGEGRIVRLREWRFADRLSSEDVPESWLFAAVRATPAESPDELAFDIVSEARQAEGIAFSVEGNVPIEWDLEVGGPDEESELVLAPALVKIGHEGEHPPRVPFETLAHPGSPGNTHEEGLDERE